MARAVLGMGEGLTVGAAGEGKNQLLPRKLVDYMCVFKALHMVYLVHLIIL